MTREEAIKIVRFSNVLMYKNPELKEALDMAIEDMKKQIPMKPDIEGDGYADGQLVYDTWICPNCETYYEIDYDNYDYCPKCGQKIDKSFTDWSEEDELS